jgi:hypothetical protein
MSPIINLLHHLEILLLNLIIINYGYISFMSIKSINKIKL